MFRRIANLFRRLFGIRSRVPRARLLFVCTGNTCRSPMAEGLANKYLALDIHSESAGSSAPNSIEPNANPKSVQVMREYGIDITDHCSRNLQTVLSLSSPFTRIVCMSAGNAAGVPSQFHDKVVVWDVPDPYGQDRDVYRHTAVVIKRKLQEMEEYL
jgi:protein-tyrosine-phosphatase